MIRSLQDLAFLYLIVTQVQCKSLVPTHIRDREDCTRTHTHTQRVPVPSNGDRKCSKCFNIQIPG